MAEGMWVVLGAAVGSAGSLGTTALTAYLGRLSAFPKYDKCVKDILSAMLRNGPKWRKLETLSRVTGMSDKDTREYLIIIGARGSETDAKLWGLISRNPLNEIGSVDMDGQKIGQP